MPYVEATKYEDYWTNKFMTSKEEALQEFGRGVDVGP